MIVSHKHKFIFIKTEKTAGTSVEIALSKYCGPDDIITYISPKDEEKRREMGYPGAQNYKIPFSRYSKLDYLRLLYHRKRRRYYNHMRASEMKPYLGDEVWNSYFKFCFERNPWDRIVSFYYWRFRKEPRPSVSEFVQSIEANKLRAFDLYTMTSEIVVDKVYLFEQLGDAMEDIRKRLNIEEPIELPRAKGHFRKDRRNYREILSEQDREKIAKVYAREIAYFGYEW